MCNDISMFGPGPTSMMQDSNFALKINSNGEIEGIVEKPKYFDENNDLIDTDLTEAGFIGDKISFLTEYENEPGKIRMLHTFFSSKGFFTIGEMIKIIIDFEIMDRPKRKTSISEIDTHNVFFEGIHETESTNCENSYYVFWSS